MAGFDWDEVGTADHSTLDHLNADTHPHYLDEERHDLLARHQRGEAVPHEEHSDLGDLGEDDHSQYLNETRHSARARHPLGVLAPEVYVVVSGGASPEPLFCDGDIITQEVFR